MDTNKTTLTLEHSTIYLKLDSRIEEFEIRKTSFGYKSKRYLNDFKEQIKESPKCFLKLVSHDPEEIEFKTQKSKDRFVFHGFLKAGKASFLGINFKIVISEIWQTETQVYCYGIDVSISRKEEREISDFARTLFDLPEKPNNDKQRKKKKDKSK